jgi:hypothetical protein
VCESLDVKDLVRCHTRLRRRFNAIYFAFACLCFTLGWLLYWITGSLDSLHWALFAAAMFLLGLFYNHLVLFNPYRDPLKTQRRLERLAKKHLNDKESWW